MRGRTLLSPAQNPRLPPGPSEWSTRSPLSGLALASLWVFLPLPPSQAQPTQQNSAPLATCLSGRQPVRTPVPLHMQFWQLRCPFPSICFRSCLRKSLVSCCPSSLFFCISVAYLDAEGLQGKGHILHSPKMLTPNTILGIQYVLIKCIRQCSTWQPWGCPHSVLRWYFL